VHGFSRMNQLIGIVDAYAWPSIVGTILYHRLLVPRRGGTTDEAAIAAAVPQVRLCLAEIDRLMAENRFLAGPHLSLADLMVVPLLHYFGNVAEGRPLLAVHPKLADWLRRMAGRQSFVATKPSDA
jgi:glutathione S-transferase